jgi:hypothetical protein
LAWRLPAPHISTVENLHPKQKPLFSGGLRVPEAFFVGLGFAGCRRETLAITAKFTQRVFNSVDWRCFWVFVLHGFPFLVLGLLEFAREKKCVLGDASVGALRVFPVTCTEWGWNVFFIFEVAFLFLFQVS